MSGPNPETTDRITLYMPKEEVALIREEAARKRLTISKVVEQQLVPFVQILKQSEQMRGAAPKVVDALHPQDIDVLAQVAKGIGMMK